MMPMPQVFWMEGRFDGQAALRLREQVMKEPAPRAIFDFSHVDLFDDATLPLLTVHLVLLRRQGREVFMRGLREHQLRVLHHFGVELAADGAVEIVSSDVASLAP